MRAIDSSAYLLDRTSARLVAPRTEPGGSQYRCQRCLTPEAFPYFVLPLHIFRKISAASDDMPPVRTAPRRATYDGLPPLIDLPDDFNQVPCYTHERCVRLLDLIGGPCAPLHPAGPARGKGSFSGWRKVLALKLQDRVERMCSVPHQRVTGYEGKLLDTREDNYEAMLRAYVGERAKDIVRSIRHRLSEAQAKATKGVDAAECGAYDLRALFVLFSEVSAFAEDPYLLVVPSC